IAPCTASMTAEKGCWLVSAGADKALQAGSATAAVSAVEAASRMRIFFTSGLLSSAQGNMETRPERLLTKVHLVASAWRQKQRAPPLRAGPNGRGGRGRTSLSAKVVVPWY